MHVWFSNGLLAQTVLYIKKKCLCKMVQASLDHSKTGTFKNRTEVDHSKTGHVRYSDGYCSWDYSYSHSLSLTIRKPDQMKSDLQKVQISNVSRFQMVGFQIHTVFVVESRIWPFYFGSNLNFLFLSLKNCFTVLN